MSGFGFRVSGVGFRERRDSLGPLFHFHDHFRRLQRIRLAFCRIHERLVDSTKFGLHDAISVAETPGFLGLLRRLDLPKIINVRGNRGSK